MYLYKRNGESKGQSRTFQRHVHHWVLETQRRQTNKKQQNIEQKSKNLRKNVSAKNTGEFGEGGVGHENPMNSQMVSSFYF